MSYDPPRPVGRLLLSRGPGGPARVRRLRRLGLAERPDPALDATAAHLAQLAEAPLRDGQLLVEGRTRFFAGLQVPEIAPVSARGQHQSSSPGPAARPRLLPPCGGPAQGTGPGTCALSAVRGATRSSTSSRHPLLPGSPAHRQHGDGAGRGVRRRRGARTQEAGLASDQVDGSRSRTAHRTRSAGGRAPPGGRRSATGVRA